MDFESKKEVNGKNKTYELMRLEELEQAGLRKSEAADRLTMENAERHGLALSPKEEKRKEEYLKKMERFERELDEILKLQKANETRGVTARDKELMRKLLKQGLVITARKEDGHLGACFYVQPLISEKELELGKEQIYRVGGLATTSDDQKSKDDILSLINEELDEAKKEGKKGIFKTDNEKLGMLLIEKGFIKVTLEECQKKYPKFLGAYINDPNNKKQKEDYQDKIFYILPGEKKE